MALYHKLLVALGYEFFADAKNLNLLSRSSLARVARAAGIDRFEITSVSLLRSSGEADLDAESVALVNRAAPFPPPPRGAQDSFAIEVSFGMRT